MLSSYADRGDYFFVLFCAGGRNVSRGRQEKSRPLERHHTRLARAGQVHAQSAGRAAQQVLSGQSDVQGRTARRVRRYAKLGRGPGTSGVGPGPGDAPVRQVLQRDHFETENRKYLFYFALLISC